MQTNTFKGKLYSLLSSMIDVNETYSLPSELGELLNLYIQKKISSKNRSQFEYDMKQILSSLSDRYGAYEPIDYSEDDVISYVLYYFPLNFPKIQYILYDLIRYGNPDVFKKREINILDVGTGCGTIPISLSFFLKSIGNIEKLNVDIIESNKIFIAAFNDLKDILNSKEYGVPIVCGNDNIISGSFDETKIIEEIDEKYDFIIFSNVINESKLSIEKLAKWIIKYKNKLNENGHLIIIEPEDEIRARRTAELKNILLKNDIDVYCPGENLWGIANKDCDNWCVIKKSIKIPENNQGFSLISTYAKGINFSYLITNKNGYILTPNSNYTKLSDLKIGTRVNVFGKVIERNEHSTVTHLFICDGTQKVKMFAYKYEFGGITPKPSHKKIEHIKINDVVIFEKVWVKKDNDGLQIEIDNATETPNILPYFDP